MAKPLEAFEFESLTCLDAKTEALAKLDALANNVDAALALRKSNGILHRAVKAWQKGRVARTAQLALDAVKADETNALAYHFLAIALEKMGHLYKALVTYEKSYELNPEDPELLINLSQLAHKFKMDDITEKLCRQYIERCPDSPLGYNNLANVKSGQEKIDEAIDILRDAIMRLPTESVLWNSLATVLAEIGRVEESVVFYREAIRLEPKNTKYYHNLGYAYMHLERIQEAIDLCEEAMQNVVDVSDRLESTYSHGICLLHIGKLKEGFRDYEVRNNKRFRGFTQYMLRMPHWQGENLAGKKILVVGEQGLGDEIMFSNVLPDLQNAVGPDGQLQIAIEPRLVSLFQRSYPHSLTGKYDDRALMDKDGNQEMRFFPFLEGKDPPDYYVEIGSAVQYFRKRIEDFPHKAFLTPDPKRVEDFRDRLRSAGPGPHVGICWRSMMLTNKRGKYYSSLDQWGPIFKTPGIHFVNLQYGDCEKELQEAEALHGVKITRLEGHDLTRDIDGNAALNAAVDLVISAPTSVAATSGAVGTETWFLLSGNGWPQLGTKEYPWYRKTRTFCPSSFADWDEAIPKIADALRDFSAAY
jgi:tetratricopeptide (TPR) repeat protein